MLFIAPILLLPGAVFIYFTKQYWKKIQDKKIRYSKTRKALVWMLLILFFSVITSFYAFKVISNGSNQLFLLVSSIYYLALDILCVAAYAVVSKANSRRNILKLVYWIIISSFYLPVIWWNYDISAAGISHGKIGVSRYMAVKIVREEIADQIKYQIVSNKNVKNGWEILASLETKDDSTSIDRNYFVNKFSGEVEYKNGEKKISINLKNEDNKLGGVEMMLLADKSLALDATQTWRPIDYTISDDGGKATMYISDQSGQDVNLQVRECGKSCKNLFYKLRYPYKDNYEINLDSLQSSVTVL